jgi:hypothetical protein
MQKMARDINLARGTIKEKSAWRRRYIWYICTCDGYNETVCQQINLGTTNDQCHMSPVIFSIGKC